MRTVFNSVHRTGRAEREGRQPGTEMCRTLVEVVTRCGIAGQTGNTHGHTHVIVADRGWGTAEKRIR